MNYAWQNVYLCICNTYLTFSLLLSAVHIMWMRRRKVKIFSIADLWHIIERLWGLKCSVSAKRKQNDWLWTGREENDRQVSALHCSGFYIRGRSQTTLLRGGGVLLTLISLINVELGINVEGGIFWKRLVHNSNKRGVEGGKI